MSYDIVIGVEIHVTLNTKSKAFCSCRNEFGAEPNTLVCPVCLGLPGALPVINKQAVIDTIMAGLCFGCHINKKAVFERKNYSYPDLSKGYQISQLSSPICSQGGIMLSSNKFIRFNRIHLEEDAGKLIHKSKSIGTLIDYNRSGVPLLEMVTEPDFTTAEEVVEFLTRLKQVLGYIGIADCKMEQGGFRFDVNISVNPTGSANLGTRVELKNLNSYKSIIHAVEYESARHIKLLSKGKPVIQETRGWDEDKMKSFCMREKEDELDYRYFPDPDILTIKIDKEDIDSIRDQLPINVDDKKNMYLSLGLSLDDALLIVSDKALSDYIEQLFDLGCEPRTAVNWVMQELLRVSKETPQASYSELISSQNLARIIFLLNENKITRTNAKILFDEAIKTSKDVDVLVKELDLGGNIEVRDIEYLVSNMIKENPQIVQDYQSSPEDIQNYIIGNIVKITNGKAKVDTIVQVIRARFNKD